jgi:hypothetical protein
MRETIILIGFLLILSGIIFLTLSPNVNHDYLIPYWFASVLVIISGILFISRFKSGKVSLFVCGECSRNFLSELDLRRHYAGEHVKKD